MENILFPDIFSKLHKNKDTGIYEKVEETLKRWNLIKLLVQLDYPDEVYDNISKIDNIAREWKKICAKVLWHWEFLKEKIIVDYTIKWLTGHISEIMMPNNSETSEAYLKASSIATRLPEEMQRKMAIHRDTKVRIALAGRKDLTKETQEILVKDSEESVKIEYLETEREERSNEAIETTAENSDEKTCLLLIEKFPTLEEWVQGNLVTHRSVKVKIALARKKYLTQRIQEKLAEDNKEIVKLAYLETERKERSDEALEIISGNSDEKICLALLEKFPNLEEWVQENLAKHRSAKVRILLVGRQDLTDRIQEKLADDNKETVKLAYLQSEREERSNEALEIIARNSDEKICLYLLEKFPNLEEEVLENLVAHRSIKVRISLAKRKNLTDRIQHKLLDDTKEAVKLTYLETEREERNSDAFEVIAGNSDEKICLYLLKKFSNLTEEAQENLSKHRSAKVRKKLAGRKDLTQRIQEKIADDNKEVVKLTYLKAEREERNEDAFQIIAGNSEEETCLLLLEKFPNLPESVLENLRTHRSKNVKDAVRV